ncbi:MAG TPA: 2-oxo acid dehydrogenase subunit E2 [Pirellulales bacterium]|jgi:pyruvate dehydrogenase E2 component (dihydrolipoamide acetyltransferase)|nr:2-oxo acid dehydrogenase subunit E2 [Pirellulales bacterium]
MSDFKLPDLGENIESGDIVSVLVNEGDIVKAQQDVVEIETDKAVVSVPTDTAGKVTKIHVSKGQTVKPGQVILSLEASTEASARTKDPAASAKASSAPSKAHATSSKAPTPSARSTSQKQHEATPAGSPAKQATSHKPSRTSSPDGNGYSPSAVPAPSTKQVEIAPTSAAADEADGHASPSSTTAPAGPAVRRLARELGVDLDRVQGTGADGRITREDVITAVRHANEVVATSAMATASPSGPMERDNYGAIRRETMTKIRKTIAANMARSATTIPHLTNFDDADISELERLRKESAVAYSSSGIKLTSLAFVLKAVSLALKQHPVLNASLDMETGEIIYKQYVNLGVAVDTDRGLIVPVLRSVDALSIPQIAQGIQLLAEKVRQGQQTLDDLRGGTFTISNLGAVGGQYSTPIINYPEVAILLAGRSRKVPVVTADDKIEPRLTMPLSLSYDHRLVDGAAASRFLNEVIGYLESSGRLLLAP